MILNHPHPAFDLAMELLALLPKHPGEVRKSDVCADLGLAKQKELAPLIERLEVGEGIYVVKSNAAGDNDVARVLSIAPRSWQRAQRLAGDYHQAVYGF